MSPTTAMSSKERLPVLFEELSELAGQRNDIDGRIVEIAAEMERDQLCGNTGARSVAALVAWKLGLSSGTAHTITTIVNRLEEFPRCCALSPPVAPPGCHHHHRHRRPARPHRQRRPTTQPRITGPPTDEASTRRAAVSRAHRRTRRLVVVQPLPTPTTTHQQLASAPPKFVSDARSRRSARLRGNG